MPLIRLEKFLLIDFEKGTPVVGVVDMEALL